MASYRVLVVEDSLTVRRRLCEILASDPEIEIVGEAEDGRRAIELAQALRPDVITLDMMLPVMTGLAVTEYVMAYCPTPILIVSASTNRGELFRTYDALAAGAVDVLDKPQGNEGDGDWERGFLARVKLVSRIKVITHPRARLEALGHAQTRRRESIQAPATKPARVVAIGVSTGGPRAIVDLLKMLPSPYPIPILLVLHISEPFGSVFVEWLDAQTAHRAAYGVDGDPLPKVSVVMAPPDRHMIVAGSRLRLTRDPERHSCRPSVDVLFESVAREYGPSAVGVLLTGMGRDGASGLLDMRQAGALTVAQDEATCAVFGMPREAIALGAAERVLPLSEIGMFLARLAETPCGRIER
ncbi:MAG TPA: chemotaxis-specific protein-glutamate methyltransferase CheB [Planctomycetota bacterium]|nr:chemotaxis-specific protein-glutamate methyltransferase CheB [Planctomycetota bacterium]